MKQKICPRSLNRQETRKIEASAIDTVNLQLVSRFYFSDKIGIVSITSDRYRSASLRLCVHLSLYLQVPAGARGDWPIAALAWQRMAATVATSEWVEWRSVPLCQSVTLCHCRFVVVSLFSREKQTGRVSGNFPFFLLWVVRVGREVRYINE